MTTLYNLFLESSDLWIIESLKDLYRNRNYGMLKLLLKLTKPNSLKALSMLVLHCRGDLNDPFMQFLLYVYTLVDKPANDNPEAYIIFGKVFLSTLTPILLHTYLTRRKEMPNKSHICHHYLSILHDLHYFKVQTDKSSRLTGETGSQRSSVDDASGNRAEMERNLSNNDAIQEIKSFSDNSFPSSDQLNNRPGARSVSCAYSNFSFNFVLKREGMIVCYDMQCRLLDRMRSSLQRLLKYRKSPKMFLSLVDYEESGNEVEAIKRIIQDETLRKHPVDNISGLQLLLYNISSLMQFKGDVKIPSSLYNCYEMIDESTNKDFKKCLEFAIVYIYRMRNQDLECRLNKNKILKDALKEERKVKKHHSVNLKSDVPTFIQNFGGGTNTSSKRISRWARFSDVLHYRGANNCIIPENELDGKMTYTARYDLSDDGIAILISKCLLFFENFHDFFIKINGENNKINPMKTVDFGNKCLNVAAKTLFKLNLKFLSLKKRGTSTSIQLHAPFTIYNQLINFLYSIVNFNFNAITPSCILLEKRNVVQFIFKEHGKVMNSKKVPSNSREPCLNPEGSDAPKKPATTVNSDPISSGTREMRYGHSLQRDDENERNSPLEGDNPMPYSYLTRILSDNLSLNIMNRYTLIQEFSKVEGCRILLPEDLSLVIMKVHASVYRLLFKELRTEFKEIYRKFKDMDNLEDIMIHLHNKDSCRRNCGIRNFRHVKSTFIPLATPGNVNSQNLEMTSNNAMDHCATSSSTSQRRAKLLEGNAKDGDTGSREDKELPDTRDNSVSTCEYYLHLRTKFLFDLFRVRLSHELSPKAYWLVSAHMKLLEFKE